MTSRPVGIADSSRLVAGERILHTAAVLRDYAHRRV
jgi:hypothetical protein